MIVATAKKRSFWQVPLAAASVLDTLLLTGKPSLQKYRQHFRTVFGIDAHAGEISLGRYGKIQLETVAMLPCLASAVRWNRSVADRLCDAYRNAGLEHILQSESYKQAVKLAAAAIQEAARTATPDLQINLATLVTDTVSELAVKEPTVRKITEELDQVTAQVDFRLAELTRLPGELVRIEGGKALITVENDGRRELRSVSAEPLTAFGIRQTGDAFYLHELHWSSETASSVYIPAVAAGEEQFVSRELEGKLRESEKLLSFPQLS
jgi:hypothetical protein